jgi:hypothetical protein
MSLPQLKHEIINKIDINKLLKDFTETQLAFFFNVPTGYISKTRGLQKIDAEEKFKNNMYDDSDEMKLGRVGSWKLSKERRFLENNNLLQSQNEEI